MTNTWRINVKNIKYNKRHYKKQSPSQELPHPTDNSAEADLTDEKGTEAAAPGEHHQAKDNESHRHYGQNGCHGVFFPPGPLLANSISDVQALDSGKNALRSRPPQEQHSERKPERAGALLNFPKRTIDQFRGRSGNDSSDVLMD